MPDETGWTEPYRVQFPSTIGNALVKLAIIESRSVPNLIRQLTIEALIRREIEKNIETLIHDLIQNGDNGQLVKNGIMPENANLPRKPQITTKRKAA
jgi:hypothetical protein